MNRFLSRRDTNFSIISLFSAFFLLFVLFFGTSCAKKPLQIGLYGLSPETGKALGQSFARYYEKNPDKTPLEVVTMDDAVPLADILKKDKRFALVLAPAGASLDSVEKLLAAPPETLYSQMPTAMREVSAQWVPLLIDHAEVAYRKKALLDAEATMPRTVSGLAAYAQAKKNSSRNARWPLVLAGKSDHALSCFASALVESTWGEDALRTLNTGISRAEQRALDNSRKKKPDAIPSVFESVIGTPLGSGTFRDVLAQIRDWQDEGLLYPKWTELSELNVSILMEDAVTDVVFMPLEEHRRIDYRVIRNFEETFFPANRAPGASFERSLVLPVVGAAAVHQKEKGADAETFGLLAHLTSRDEQAYISLLSGLAPVDARAETADSQASNVRFWAAASGSLCQPIGSAFTSKAEREAFFAAFRAFFAE